MERSNVGTHLPMQSPVWLYLAHLTVQGTDCSLQQRCYHKTGPQEDVTSWENFPQWPVGSWSPLQCPRLVQSAEVFYILGWADVMLCFAQPVLWRRKGNISVTVSWTPFLQKNYVYSIHWRLLGLSAQMCLFFYKWPWVNELIHLWAAAEMKKLYGLPIRCVSVLPCQCAKGMDLFQTPSLHVPVWLPLRMGGLTFQAAIAWFCLWILQLVRGLGSCESFSFNLYVLKFPHPEEWKRSGGSQCLQGHSALCSNLPS